MPDRTTTDDHGQQPQPILKALLLREFNRRQFVKGAAVAGAGLGLTGGVGALLEACAPSSSPSTSSSAPSGTLNWTSGWNPQEPQAQVIKGVIADFQKVYPKVTVNVTFGGRQVLTQVKADILANRAPDLIDKDSDDIGAAIINPGLAMPLDDVINAKIYGESNTIADVVNPQSLAQYQSGGQRYLVPYELFTIGFWYNGATFASQGWSPPTSWSDFTALVSKIKSSGAVPLAADGTIDFFNAWWFPGILQDLAGPGFFHSAAGDKTGAKWDDPNVLTAAQTLQSFVAMQPFESSYPGSKWPAAEDAWAQGKMTMLLLGTWAPSETATFASPSFQYRSFGFPSPGSQDTVPLFTWGFTIPSKASNPAAAKAMISFMMAKNELQGIVSVAKNITSRKDLDVPPQLSDAYKSLTGGATLVRQFDNANEDYPLWWNNVFLPLSDKLFFGSVGASDFVSALKQQSVHYWQTQG